MNRKITKDKSPLPLGRMLSPTILLTILGLLTITPKGYSQTVQFQDPASSAPVPQERILTIRLPLLDIPRITVTNRDPFVSAEVKDPYVIDSPIEEETPSLIATEELIVYLEKTIKESLASAIKVIGVSSGEPGKGNYALILGAEPESDHYDGGTSLKAEGDTLTLTLQGESLRKLQEAVIVASGQGFKLDVGIELADPNQAPVAAEGGGVEVATPEPTSTEVTLKKIDRRKVTFRHNPSQQEFEVKFEKDLRVRPQNQAPQGGNQAPLPQGGPPPPPKI